MPPRIPKVAAGQRGLLRLLLRQYSGSICSICCFTTQANSRSRARQRASNPYSPSARTRKQSTLAGAPGIDPEQQIVKSNGAYPNLKAALIDLQKHSQSYVNLSRLQLALRGLEQPPGEETIRIAVLGVGGDGRTPSRIRDLVRLLFADPLKEEEEWELALINGQDAGGPLLVRIGHDINNSGSTGISNRLLREIPISSVTLNAHRLELLVLETDIVMGTGVKQDDLVETLLIPTVEIPTSTTGRFSPITTPVHKALILGEGVLGAASLVTIPFADPQTILPAANIPGYVNEHSQESALRVIDIPLANEALGSFRKSLGNAMSYEHDWFKSGVPELLEWLKEGTQDMPSGPMKSPIHILITSLLADASRKIHDEESRQLSTVLSSKVSSSALYSLREDLKSWSQRAHTELRDQLDIAFEGRRWRKLGWWKLFWRVDDVSMITSDILNQRFLTEAEKELIYLAGQIEQAGIFKSKAASMVPQSNWAYTPLPNQPPSTATGSSAPPVRFKDVIDRPEDDATVSIKPQPWPLHIPTTRGHLSMVTVPALQALAQKLVFQTLTTSSFASAFAGLIYVSSLSTSFYEAGTVAALGIVWSLRSMQTKWERARTFWEKEVREEGRKAVRSVEVVVSNVLEEPPTSTPDGAEELDQARNAVERARQALDVASGHVNN